MLHLLKQGTTQEDTNMGTTPPSTSAEIGAQVRRARKARGWTGAQLAEVAGVAGGTIVRIENGREVRPGNLRAVLDALELVTQPQAPADADEDARFAVELVGKWIEALDPEDRAAAIRDLTRFVVTRHTGL